MNSSKRNDDLRRRSENAIPVLNKDTTGGHHRNGSGIRSKYSISSGIETNGSGILRGASPYSGSPSPQRGSLASAGDSFKESGARLPDLEDSDFYINPKDIEIGPVIGEGAFSTVYAARYFRDIVAVKKQTRKGKDLEKYLKRELQVLKLLRHKNMLEYIGAYNVLAKIPGQFHALFIVTQYAAGGDLLKLLLRHEHPIGWKFRIRILKEGLEALEYLHSQDLIHRDIKSSNFLLDADFSCKLSDFGMAREVCSDGKMTICGTDEYMAPEMLFGEEFSQPADMYSFGMVLLEVITRRKIGDSISIKKNGIDVECKFAKRHARDLFKLDEEELISVISEDVPPSLKQLTLQCLQNEPEDRLTTEDACGWLEDLYQELNDDTCPIPPLPVVEGMFEIEEEKETLSEALASFSRIPPNVAITNNSLTYSTVDSYMPLPQLNTQASSINSTIQTSAGVSQVLTTKSMPSKMGHLHVKNQGVGFRNWKKRLFTLKGGDLTCLKNDETQWLINLCGWTLVRGKTNRFQIAKVFSDSDMNADGEGQKIELSASDPNEFESWLSALQQGIHFANGLGNDIPVRLPSQSSQKGLTVQEWLTTLNMTDLIPAFIEKGFIDMDKISSKGLTSEDMDRIGIKNPLRRRYLETLGRIPFHKNLQVTVIGHRSFGDVVVFKVVSEWRAWHSKTEKLFTDFNKLHNKMRRALKDEQSPLLQKLPDLPGKGKVVQNQTDNAFILQRKNQLQGYIQELVHVIGYEEPYFTILCDALDLLPSPPEPVALS